MPQVWYGAPYTATLVLDLPMPAGSENAVGIERRGWCIFERRLSSITKHGYCCLTLSRTPEDAAADIFWADLADACMADRLAPMAPDAFEELMVTGMEREKKEKGTGIAFTNGKDATKICIPQYREGFLRLMGDCTMLSFDSCGWHDEEARQLAGALAFAHAQGATTPAHTLRLFGNRLTDAALPHLVAAFEAGALPSVDNLVLLDNRFTDAAIELLRPLLTGQLSAQLTQFSCGGDLTAAGVRKLTAIISDGHLEQLKVCRPLHLHMRTTHVLAHAHAEQHTCGNLPDHTHAARTHTHRILICLPTRNLATTGRPHWPPCSPRASWRG